jgi:oxygen-dependent protoporphyrinogen oxidase
VSRIAVIGGGIAGLAAAYRLMNAHDVTLFEREPVTGGKIRSEHCGEFLFEWGPGGFLSSAADVLALVNEVGLGDEIAEAGPAAKNRFIFWNGTLHKVPAKPPEMLRMRLLSTSAKLRALGDLVIPKRSERDGEDESIFAFIERRFGRDVAERIVAPVVLGVSGGDAKTTSLAAVFPRLPVIERESGSIIRGMIRGARTAAQMCTFSGGMQQMTGRLAERLGDRVRTETPVKSIVRTADGWRVDYAGGSLLADGVIVATPAPAAADLIVPFDEQLAALVRTIRYAPMRVAGIAFRSADVAASLDAFGFLAARGSGVRILGAVYVSTIAPEQAAPGTVYLRVFLGGAADPGVVALDAESVRDIVRADLATALGITAEPVAYHEAVWPQAIPQYTLQHRSTVRAIEAASARHPGLALTGNAYRGLGVGDTVRDALAIAQSFA